MSIGGNDVSEIFLSWLLAGTMISAVVGVFYNGMDLIKGTSAVLKQTLRPEQTARVNGIIAEFGRISDRNCDDESLFDTISKFIYKPYQCKKSKTTRRTPTIKRSYKTKSNRRLAVLNK